MEVGEVKCLRSAGASAASGLAVPLRAWRRANREAASTRRGRGNRRVVGGLLDAILRGRLRSRLPLHVLDRVRAAALQRRDVIDDVAGTRSGAEPPSPQLKL